MLVNPPVVPGEFLKKKKKFKILSECLIFLFTVKVSTGTVGDG